MASRFSVFTHQAVISVSIVSLQQEQRRNFLFWGFNRGCNVVQLQNFPVSDEWRSSTLT